MRAPRRASALDPLLPRERPLPAPGPGDVVLRVPGAEGLVRRRRPDPDAFEASWGAAEQQLLFGRLTGEDRPAALDALLAAWAAGHGSWPPGGDAEAVFTWPSRDTALTPVLLAHGLVPKRVAAVRTAGRLLPGPRGRAEALIRPLEPADLAPAAELWLEGLGFDARFGSCVPRPSSARNVRERLATGIV